MGFASNDGIQKTHWRLNVFLLQIMSFQSIWKTGENISCWALGLLHQCWAQCPTPPFNFAATL
jgi:hypothetical protein